MLEKDLEIRDNNKQWQKLVDYYNQWWEEKFWEKWPFTYKNRFDEVHLVSKKMKFIEWLVQKEKINLWWTYDIEWYHFNIHTYLDLIMLLSIQDNPITFLLSILK